MIPKPGHSLAAGEIEQGSDRSAGIQTHPRADTFPLAPIVTGSAVTPGDAILPQSGLDREHRAARQATPEQSEEIWTSEVDRLFTAALDQLRRQAEQASAAIEQRRIADITELSRAIKKQHDIIEGLKREIAQARQAEALRLSEARQEWQQFETKRMNAAREAWEAEKAELRREVNHHRSVAEQLADQLAALKANDEFKERQYLERLKEITTEVDRCLLRARAEWVSEVARMADADDWQLPSFLTKAGSPSGT